MELIYYIMLFLLLNVFIRYILSFRNLNRANNIEVIPINTFNIDEIENFIHTYELSSTSENIICPITQENIPIGENIYVLSCGHQFSIPSPHCFQNRLRPAVGP